LAMKIAAHITFFFVKHRLPYLQQVIASLEALPYSADIFLYCNEGLNGEIRSSKVIQKKFLYRKSGFLGYNNGFWNKVGLTRFVHPFHLSWENRKVIEKNIDKYDLQLYLEDDLAFTADNLFYWLHYKKLCLPLQYNVGFLRKENNPEQQFFLTDLMRVPQNQIKIGDQLFLVNDVNPYCGFWIYDKEELKQFAKSEEWKFNFRGLPIREKSAIGWHGTMMNRYKATLIPVSKTTEDAFFLPASSTVHHLPNSYINNPMFCQVKLSKSEHNYKVDKTVSL
jgi:hypothetical protein